MCDRPSAKVLAIVGFEPCLIPYTAIAAEFVDKSARTIIMKTLRTNSENLKINTFDGGGLCHARYDRM